MLIWSATIIPVFTAVILYQKYRRETVWWEFLLPFFLTFILCLGSKSLTEHLQTREMEYWTGSVIQAEYYEPWDEEVSCRHPVYETDSKGNSRFVGYAHAYDVDYHPAYWQIIDSNNLSVEIDSETFERLCQKFGNRQFINLHRNYHSINGNEYQTNWHGEEILREPVITSHSYENRIKCSNSVFRFAEVSPEKYGLLEHPKIHDFYQQSCVLGDGGITQHVAEEKLNRWNAKLGPSKQVRIFIIVFRDKPLQAAIEQQCYWQGGNKNEFVIAVGADSSDNVEWCYPFSWTEVEQLKIEVRDIVNNQKKLNLEKIVEVTAPKIGAEFKRKHFKDFNYLTVEPPTWAVILIFLVTIAINSGLCWWIVNNQFSNDSYPYYRSWNSRR